MIVLAASILALAIAVGVVGTALVLRSTVIRTEALRIEATAARWNARLEEAIGRIEGEGDRLAKLEKQTADQQKVITHHNTVLALKGPRR